MGQKVVDSITVRDFLSYHEEQTVELGGRGPVAVVGDNGTGKSTMVSKAMAWCLFGSCAPERMGSATKALRGKDVMRKKLEPAHDATPDPEKCTVSIWFRDLDDGTQHQVTRFRGYTGQDVIYVRTVNTEAGYDEVVGDTQAAIDQLIGADYTVFVRTCLRGQSDPWNFAEATDGKKREILDSISGAMALDEPHKRAKVAYTEAKGEALNLRVRAEDAERRAQGIEVDGLQRQAAEWDGSRAERVKSAQDEIEHLVVAFSAAQKADADAAGADAKRNDLRAARPSVDFTPYDQAIALAHKKEGEAKVALDIARSAKAKADGLLAIGSCPECGQELAPGSIAHQVAAIDIKEGPCIAAREYREECARARDAAVQWLAAETATWQAQMDAIPNPGEPRAPAVEAAVDMARKRLAEIEESENPYKHATAQAKAQRYDLQREAAVFREQQADAERRMRMAEAWVGVLSPKGVRAHMAEGALAAIEAEANKWLSVLSDGRLTVSFPPTQTTKKTKAVREEIKTIIRTSTTELPFLAYSGGEKTRINLAVDLGVAATFARGGALSLSLLVLDEQVFSGLDSAGQSAVVTALHHAGVADVVVIDHDPKLTGVLPRTIRATIGPDGYSRVKED